MCWKSFRLHVRNITLVTVEHIRIMFPDTECCQLNPHDKTQEIIILRFSTDLANIKEMVIIIIK